MTDGLGLIWQLAIFLFDLIIFNKMEKKELWPLKLGYRFADEVECKEHCPRQNTFADMALFKPCKIIQIIKSRSESAKGQ